MPYIGDGDIAVDVYKGRAIYGADIDMRRVETARKRLDGAIVVQANCNQFPFVGEKRSFSICDADAYGNPYLTVSTFWRDAEKDFPVVVFGTDGLRQHIKRGKVTIELPEGRKVDVPGLAFRGQYNFWWSKFVLPYLEQLIAPHRVVESVSYLRKDMLYWGIVCR